MASQVSASRPGRSSESSGSGEGQSGGSGGPGSGFGGLSGLGDLVTGAIGRIADAVTGDSDAEFDNSDKSEKATVHRGWSTGSPECCVCPICRAMASMRDPGPDTAAKLAAGAGDFATGVAGLMRAFSAVSSATAPKARSAPPRPEPTPDQSWSAATRATAGPAREAPVDESADPWGAATRRDAATAREKPEREEPVPGKPVPGKPSVRREKPAEEPVVTGHTGDVWAAATANGRKPGESAVAGSSAVDHDVAAPEEHPGAAEQDGRD
ncbi:hypothetical protein [Symbioplanes lichenis]|uniref:hypothetical protein n=1 Tax=Symbioplanes lichenis TaxID=1629072 RepID=UPI0027390D3B|nr:hypothetical protein [Actinoplanes lichenis]